jgi:predicted transcriptional regulator
MIKDPFFAYTSDSLHQALVRLSSNDLQEMPVLSNEDHKVIGMVTISDLVRLYDAEVEKIKKQRNQSDLSIGVSSDEFDDKESSTDESTKKSPI